MNRKHIIFGLFLFIFLSPLAPAQQATKSDIQGLEAKINNLETTVREMDKRLAAQIQAVQVTMLEMDKRLSNRIEELDKRLSFQTNILLWTIGTLIGIVLAVIVLPQVLGYFREKRARVEFQERIDELERRLEQQQREIDELKSRRVYAPS